MDLTVPNSVGVYDRYIGALEAEVARLTAEHDTADQGRQAVIGAYMWAKNTDIAKLRGEQRAMLQVQRQSTDLATVPALRTAMMALCVGMADIESRRVQDRATTVTRICQFGSDDNAQCDALRAEGNAASAHADNLRNLLDQIELAHTGREVAAARDALTDEMQAMSRGIVEDERRLSSLAGRMGAPSPGLAGWLPAWVTRLASTFGRMWDLLRQSSVSAVWRAVANFLTGDGVADDGVSGGDEGLTGDLPSRVRVRPPPEAFDPDTGGWRSAAAQFMWTRVQRTWETSLTMYRAASAWLKLTLSAWIESNPVGIRADMLRWAAMVPWSLAGRTLLTVGVLRLLAVRTEMIVLGFVSAVSGLSKGYIIGMQLGGAVAMAQAIGMLDRLYEATSGTGGAVPYYTTMIAMSYVLTYCDDWASARQLQAADAVLGARPNASFDDYKQDVRRDPGRRSTRARAAAIFAMLFVYSPYREILRQLEVDIVGSASTYHSALAPVIGVSVAVARATVNKTHILSGLPVNTATVLRGLVNVPRSYVGPDPLKTVEGLPAVAGTLAGRALIATTIIETGGELYDTERENRKYTEERSRLFRSAGTGAALESVVKMSRRLGVLPPPEQSVGKVGTVTISSAPLPLPEGFDAMDPATLDEAMRQFTEHALADPRGLVRRAVRLRRIMRSDSVRTEQGYRVDSPATLAALVEYSFRHGGEDNAGTVTYVPDPADGNVVGVAVSATTARVILIGTNDLGAALLVGLMEVRDAQTRNDTTAWGSVLASLTDAPGAMPKYLTQAVIETTVALAVAEFLGAERALALGRTVVDMTDRYPNAMHVCGLLGKTLIIASVTSAVAGAAMLVVPPVVAMAGLPLLKVPGLTGIGVSKVVMIVGAGTAVVWGGWEAMYLDLPALLAMPDLPALPAMPGLPGMPEPAYTVVGGSHVNVAVRLLLRDVYTILHSAAMRDYRQVYIDNLAEYPIVLQPLTMARPHIVTSVALALARNRASRS